MLPLTEVNVHLQFKLLNEGEFNIEGIEYEINAVKTKQYVDCNGNGLLYGSVNEYNNPLLAIKKATSRKKKALLNLRNIKIYPEIPLIDVHFVGDHELMLSDVNCLVLYDYQSCELVFNVTNTGKYDVNYIKGSVYVYKRQDYKVMLKDSQVQIDNISVKSNEHLRVKVNYLHKRSHLKIEIRFHYTSNEFKCVNSKEEGIIHPFVQVIKDIKTEYTLTYDHFKYIPKLNCNSTHGKYNELIECDYKRINTKLIKEYIYCNDRHMLSFVITNISNNKLSIIISDKQLHQQNISDILPVGSSKRMTIEMPPLGDITSMHLTWEQTSSPEHKGIIPLKDIVPVGLISSFQSACPILFNITATSLSNDDNVEYTLLTYSLTNNSHSDISRCTILIYIYTSYNGSIALNEELTGKAVYYEGNLTYQRLSPFKSGDRVTRTVKLFKLNKDLLLLSNENNIRTTCMLFDNESNVLYLSPFDRCV